MAFCQVNAVVMVSPDENLRSSFTWSELKLDEKPAKYCVTLAVVPYFAKKGSLALPPLIAWPAFRLTAAGVSTPWLPTYAASMSN